MDKKDIMVTVICRTYNHGEFIEDALKGFVMQKTNFPFEVIVHDDASTDNAPEIIKKYYERYPDIIKPILQEENQYKKKVDTYKEFIFPITRGKYIALCEGDDYWIDENKLQKQVDYMESHPDCHMTMHNSLRLDCVTMKTKNENPFEKEMDVDAGMLINNNGGWPATASLVMNAKYYMERPDLFKHRPVGDYPLRLYFSTLGKVHYFDDVMSVYRANNDVSWTRRRTQSKEMRVKIHLGMIEFLKDFDEYTNYKYRKEVAKYIERREYRLLCENRDKKVFKTNIYKKLPIGRKIVRTIEVLCPWAIEFTKRIIRK